ncbi:hypothetical protein ABFP60_02720 [Clostridioides difficile]
MRRVKIIEILKILKSILYRLIDLEEAKNAYKGDFSAVELEIFGGCKKKIK